MHGFWKVWIEDCWPPIKNIYFKMELFRVKPCDSKSVISQPMESTDSQQLKSINHQSIPTLQEDLLKLYENGHFSDVTISCKGRDFKVHRNILESRSSIFKTIFENEVEEPVKHELNDVDPEVLELFLKFIYTGAIEFPVDMICDIFDLSLKYNLQDLSNICKCEMVKSISVSTAVKFLISSDKHGISVMKKNVLKFIKENIKDVFESDEFKTYIANRCDLMVSLIASIACSEEEGE